ncbi:hypothetical protein C8J57DRAFT_1226504 [Mycena rebaudengoi]|nr:hypothetical protein C8J57DRAFT_1226504 [Mycena rebaudengoi]
MQLLNSGGIQAAPLNVLIEKLEDGPYGRTASLSTSTPPSGENHILGSLVHRMMYYLRLPATFVVVFDGPCCESESRRNKYIASYELAQNFKEFLRALGVSSHTAPGEAEPELAEMTRRHLLGAVLTDSFQVVAFGALKIIRDSTLKEGRDSIFYTAASIEEKSGLGRGGLGLLGCGRVIAQSLAQKGFGDSLLTAVQTLNQDALEEFLSRWKVAVIDALASSAHGDVGRRYPTLAQRIRDDPHFPPVRALRHYVSPRTSWSVGAGPRVFPPVSLPMDLAAVGFLCEKFLQWGTTLKTRNVLFKLLYPARPGILAARRQRELRRPFVFFSPSNPLKGFNSSLGMHTLSGLTLSACMSEPAVNAEIKFRLPRKDRYISGFRVA